MYPACAQPILKCRKKNLLRTGHIVNPGLEKSFALADTIRHTLINPITIKYPMGPNPFILIYKGLTLFQTFYEKRTEEKVLEKGSCGIAHS